VVAGTADDGLAHIVSSQQLGMSHNHAYHFLITWGDCLSTYRSIREQEGPEKLVKQMEK
jgi:hypothetical protein